MTPLSGRITQGHQKNTVEPEPERVMQGGGGGGDKRMDGEDGEWSECAAGEKDGIFIAAAVFIGARRRGQSRGRGLRGAIERGRERIGLRGREERKRVEGRAVFM